MQPPDIGSWTLSMVALWCDQCPGNDCFELMAKKFEFEELWTNGVSVINEMANDKLVPDLKRIPKPQSGLISREFAKLIVDAVGLIRASDYKLNVPIEDLEKVPGITKTGRSAEDGTAVATRLATLETSQERLSEQLREILQKIEAPVLLAPPPAPAPAAARVQAPARVPAPAPGPAPAVMVNGDPAPNFGALFRGRSQTISGAGGQRSNSKRRRVGEDGDSAAVDNNEGFVPVDRRRRKPKATPGSNSVQVNVANAINHCDFYIGNTHPDSDMNLIKEVLILASKNMPDDMKLDSDLEVEVVKCLSELREGQTHLYSKNWHIRVPQKFKTHMERPEALPIGWTCRKFYAPRRPRPPVSDLRPVTAGHLAAVRQAAGQSRAQPQLPHGAPGYVPPGLPPNSA